MAEKQPRTEWSDGEVVTWRFRHKGYLRNISTDSDEEAIGDLEDHQELYNKTNENSKDKAFERGSQAAISCLSVYQHG